jgi:hypothetical protein
MFKGELRTKAQLSVATNALNEDLFSGSLASIIRVYLYIVVG